MGPHTISLAGWRASFRRGNTDGEALQVGGRTIVPVASITSLTVSGFGDRVGVTNTTVQPVSIRVTDETGTKDIPIRDMTRTIVSALFMGSTLLSLALRIALANKRR